MPADALVDVGVVGGGVVGLATALALAETGVGRVVVYERSGLNSGASGVQPGGVRQQWSTAPNVALARESLDFFASLPDRVGSTAEASSFDAAALRFTPCGYVFAASSAETLSDLERTVGIQNALGVPSRVISEVELAEAVPGITSERFLGAAVCDEDGYFDQPQTVVEAVAAAARAAGVEIEIAEVRSLQPAGTSWLLQLADGSHAQAGAVVVAAHIDTVELLRPLGIVLPMLAEDRFLFLSEPVHERLLEPLFVAVDWHFAAKHLASGRVLASDLTAAGGGPDDGDGWRRSIRRAIAELVPLLSYVTFPILVRGIYDMTPDAQPIVGAVPGQANLWLACGFNGRGFMLAPAIGKRLARVIAGDRDALVSELGLERFDRAPAEPEGQVV